MITQEYYCDLIPSAVPFMIHVSQYDKGSRKLIFHLIYNSQEFTPPAGSTASIEGVKPDGKGYTYDATLQGSTVSVDLTTQMTAVDGDSYSKLIIANGDEILGTAPFVIRVNKAAVNGDTPISESDYPAIREAIDAASKASASANEAKTQANNAKTSATNAAKSVTDAQAVVDSFAERAGIATTSSAGMVKPDGKTILVEDDGTVSSVGGFDSTPIVSESVDYIKIIPDRVNDYCLLEKVGGMSIRNADTLIDAKVNEIESVGKNLLPLYADGKINKNGVIVKTFSDGKVVIDGTCTSAYGSTIENGVAKGSSVNNNTKKILLKGGVTYTLSKKVISGSTTYETAILQFRNDSNTETLISLYNRSEFVTYTPKQDTLTIPRIYIGGGNATYDNYTVYLMITADGTTAEDNYSKYLKSTKTIPSSAIAKCADYGIGINDDCYNYIEYSNGKWMYHQRLKSVDMGSLTWYASGSGVGRFYSSFTDGVKSTNNLLCSAYPFTGKSLEYVAGEITTGTDSDGVRFRVFVLDTKYSDASSFKAAMSGEKLYYELETEIVTDITTDMEDFGGIEVEAGGTITFKGNADYEVAVPNREVFYTKSYWNPKPITKAEWDALPPTKYADNKAYYITDTGSILVNGNLYGGAYKAEDLPYTASLNVKQALDSALNKTYKAQDIAYESGNVKTALDALRGMFSLEGDVLTITVP